MSETVFVAGITGCQGGAVAHHALKKGWTVHGLARNIDAPAAKALVDQGVRLFPGDYDNTAALEAAMAGCTAVFIALVPQFRDLPAEVRWTKSILSIAKAAGVQTAVASTGVGSGHPERFSGWKENSVFARAMLSKKGIEEAVEAAGMPNWTILRPGFFMANFLVPKVAMYPGFRETGVWTTALLATTRLPLVDDLDIGAFAVAAIADPGKFGGKKIEIGFDVRAPAEIVQVLSAATGRPLEAAFLEGEALEAAKASNPFIDGYFAMRSMIDLVDIDAVKAYGIPMGSFDAYVQRRIEDVKTTFL
ncbi:hypothetical protein HMPREF1624_03746 [Sporothrix schenckii ATCC 58251]|uniref:NmrA-like domain-containing protein n=1 Tax=Sporothrix schenckii (strain ATCC 58251 / de Perez 2211183) TaxID=1391915 RepID=U7Q077_SPOS1|nr:hypothetical protein HMPREF1624_03746 [Sporothrix schenckii ATCC 58251]